jgi:hypothetical protein
MGHDPMGRRTRAMTIGILGILIGLGANVLTANAVLSLLAEPVGARIRMVLGPTLVYGALLGVCGGAVSLVAVRQEGTRWAGVTGLVLGLSPFPLSLFLFRYVQGLKHLVFLP